jgi:hypothetical protein
MVKIARAVRYCALDVQGVRFQTFHVSDARIHLRQKCLAQVASRASADTAASLDIDPNNSCGAAGAAYAVAALSDGSATHRISKDGSEKSGVVSPSSHQANSSRQFPIRNCGIRFIRSPF